MEKTLYRIAGALILTFDLIMYSLIIQMANLINSSYLIAGYSTVSPFSIMHISTHITFVVVLILAVIIGIVVPSRIKD